MRIKRIIMPLMMVLFGGGFGFSALADDIDVFQGLSAATVENDPKILLMVDTSGSMRCPVNEGGTGFASKCKDQPHATQKITKVQDALKSLIHSLGDDVSIGLSRFNGPGGSIVYPIRRLGDYAGQNENDAEDEYTVILPVVSAYDEATKQIKDGSLQYFQDDPDRPDNFQDYGDPDADYKKGINLVVGSQEILLRFPDAYIPKGAEVTNAELVLYVSGNITKGSVNPKPTINIGVLDDVDMPEVKEELFTAGLLRNIDIEIPEWQQNDFLSIPITSLFSSSSGVPIHGQSSWCAGNAFGLKIQTQTTLKGDVLKMMLMAGEPSAAPRIKLTFKKGNLSNKSCIRRQFTQDLEEDNIKLNSTKDLIAKPVGENYEIIDDGQSLILGDDYKNLLEFESVNLPFPTTDTFDINSNIGGVFLELTSKLNVTGNTDVTIQLVNDSAGAINGEFFKTTDGLTSSKVTWSLGSIKADEVYRSSDLKSLLSEINWQPGDGIRVYLTSSATNEKEMYTFEGNYVNQPRLIFNWNASFENQVVLSSRFKLLNLVENLPEGAGTPIAGALFEASQYLLGKSVYTGSYRGWGFSDFGTLESKMTNTVSSTLTLTRDENNKPITEPGTLLCPAFERSRQCMSETLYGQYQSPLSPLSDECENAHIVLIGDGNPWTKDSVNEGEVILEGSTLKQKVKDMIGEGFDMPSYYDIAEPKTEDDIIDDCSDTKNGEFGTSSFKNASMNCSYIISKYLLDDWDIKTHVIGFAYDNTMFEKIATKYGGGLYATTNSSSGLRAAIKNTIHSTYSAAGSIISPGIAVNQFSRFKHLDRLFFSVFEPTDTRYWLGNIKQYALNDDSEIVGMTSSGGKSTQSAVVRDEEGKASVFSKDTRSFWSEEVDGNNIKIGGAAALLKPDSWSKGDWTWDIVDNRRNVFSFLGAYAAPSDGVSFPSDDVSTSNNVADTSNELSSDLSSWNTAKKDTFKTLTGISDEVESQDFLDWLAGYVPGSGRAELRMQMGAPLHSQTTLVNFGYDFDKDDPSAASQFEKQWNTIFVSTNEGALHAIDALSGREFFSFFPQELLPHAVQMYNDTKIPSLNHVAYGLDSTWTPWRLDYITKASEDAPWQRDGYIKKSDKDHVYLYGGMRRGGRNYYALDVTDVHRGNHSDLSPKLLWVIKGGSEDFERLGQTWSEPNLVALESSSSSSSSIRRAIVFGGGYDPAYDENRGTLSDIHSGGGIEMGNAFYAVDAVNGKVLFWASGDSAADKSDAKMDYPIPGNVKGIDLNGNGLTDRFYFADLGGQIWRLDWNNSVYGTGNEIDNTTRASLHLIAKLGHSNSASEENDRRFYESLSVAKILDASGDARIAILGVTGNRANPLEDTVQNRAFIIFDEVGAGYPSLPITELDLVKLDLAGGAERVSLGGKQGWYFDLNKEDGEKAWGAPTIINNNILLSTFVPSGGSIVEVSNDACGATADFGYSIIYGMSIFDGSSTGILDNIASLDDSELGARWVKVAPTGGVNLLIGDDGDITIVSGTESFKANGLSLKPRKVRWRRHENTLN